MYRRLILLFFVCTATFAGPSRLMSQDLTLLSTAGGLATSLNLFLSYSIGEPCISYTSEGEYWITEGFQQPGHMQIMVSTAPAESTSGLIAYPNPTSTYITISGVDPGTCMDLRLTDMLGQFAFETQLTSSASPRIDIGHLPAGLYVLTIRCKASSIFSQSILII